MKQTILLALALSAAHAAAAGPAPAALTQAIGSFADFKTLRAREAELDAVLSAYCKKTRAIKDADGVFYEYDCAPSSGLKSAQLTANKAGAAPPSLTLLHVVFGNAHYAEMRKLVLAKLGKPARTDVDRTTWEDTAGRERNKQGTPTITMTRDRDEQLTSFDVSLETGL